MKITHEIYKCELVKPVNLLELHAKLENCIYSKSPFHSIEWKEYGGNCQIFASNKIVCHGKELQKYLQKLQALGYDVSWDKMRLVTRSASHRLSGPINYYVLTTEIPDIEWHPELFHAPILKRNGISYIIYHSGVVVLTGLKTEDDWDEAMSVLLELELCI